ncbi:MAG: YitT family protein [Clostridiaceae bacterium]
MKKKIKEYVLITLGMVLVAVGMYFFLMPNDLATGGVNGMGIIINHYLPFISVGFLMIIMNIILFIIAFLIIGPNFGGKTIYVSIGLSGMIWALEIFYPVKAPLSDDMLLQLIVGILISGTGMGIVFNQNASTGGTDIIAKIINKFFHIDLGKAILMSDFIITIFASLTFGITKGLYAMLGVIMNGYVIDNVIEGFSVCKEVVIISEKGDLIKKFIIDELQRGATIYYAKGAFSGENKEVITTIIDRKEYVKLRNYIKEIDTASFITIKNIRETLGEGFKSIIE